MIYINDEIQLTPFLRSDKANLLLYMNDPELYANTLRVPHPYTELDADNWFNLIEQAFKEQGLTHNWAIRSVEHGVIGGIGAFLLAGLEGHRDEIGYWLAKPFRGSGIMSMVLERFCIYLFESRPTLVRIEAKVFPFNPASARVLEKTGFEREGYARKLDIKNGEYRDSLLYSRLRAF